MTGIFNAAFLGILQGITEFIPVSSSGHLVVIPRLLGVEAPGLVFDIVLHAGTLLAVLIFFRKDIAALFISQKRLGFLVLFATMPIIICGLLFADKMSSVFENTTVTGWMFIINGFILFSTFFRLRVERPRTSAESWVSGKRGLWTALLIGVAQSFALFPGISRSGVTITSGIYRGLEKKDIYRFSFLLFVPAGFLALLYSVKEACFTKEMLSADMLVGAVFSVVFGLISLKALYGLIKKARLYLVGIYCMALGLLTLYIL